jgi:hypothetical protein
MVDQMGKVEFHITSTLYADAITVTTREELARALRQHERPVVIRNEKLARPFERLRWAQELPLWVFVGLLVGLLYWAVWLSYGVNIKGHFEINRTWLPSGDFEITLTPTSPTAPRSSPPSATEE